jgi:tetratricopeptide (TPR) repeat protein
LGLLFVLSIACHGSAIAAELTAQDHAGRAARFVEARDFNRAEVELRQAVQKAPQNPAYLSDLGSVLRAQKKLTEAEECYRKALTFAPDHVVIWRNRALTQWDAGNLSAARATLENALRLRPGDTQTTEMLGVIAERLQDYRRAVELLEPISESVRQSPESMAALANSYYRTGQSDKARRLLEGLLPKTSQDPAAVFSCARLAEAAGDYPTAEKLLHSIESRFPEPQVVEYYLAYVQFQMGRLQESRRRLLELIRRGQPSEPVYNLLGHCYQAEGQLEAALNAFQEAIVLAPDEPQNYLDWLRLMARQNQWRAVLEKARAATQRIPQAAELYEVKGLAETMLLLTSDAIQAFQRALQLNPKSSRANLGLATAQSEAGMDEAAERTLSRGLQLFPDDALHYQEYGLALLKRAAAGDTEAESRGISLLEKALRLNSELSEAHYHLGQVELERQRFPSALEHLEAAARLEPNRSKMQFALARAYRNLGKLQEAQAALQTFRQLKAAEEKSNPGFPAIGRSRAPGPGDHPQ